MRRTEGRAAADVDGVLGMMVADGGAAKRRGAMVMAANVVLVAVSDRSISGVASTRAARRRDGAEGSVEKGPR